MVVFPTCKINLGLRVLDKRADGFHNIETIFYPVQWCDALEAIPESILTENVVPTDRNNLSFETKGLKIDGSEKDNLCVKAFRLLQQKYNIPPVKMCLLKIIPIGAGLGGGSSDAGFTLKLLSDLFKLNITGEELKAFASQLGSDCPFFIENTPVIASGRGDELHPIELVLSNYHVIIVIPPIHVSTKMAYASIDSRKSTGKKLDEITRQPIEVWKEILKNDFEEIVFRQYPEIAKIKTQLYELGALYASMSGSGSAVYGIFKEQYPELSFPETYRIFKGKL